MSTNKTIFARYRNIPTQTIVIAILLVLIIMAMEVLFVRLFVRKRVEETINGQLDVICFSAEGNLRRLKGKADVLEEIVSQSEDYSDIHDQLEFMKKNSAVYDFCYLTKDGTLYLEDGTVKTDNHDFDFLFDIRKNQFTDNYYAVCINTEVDGKNKSVVIGAKRDYVIGTDELLGYFIVSCDLDRIFENILYEQIDDKGSGCIVNAEGVIYDHSENFRERFGDGDNFYDLLIASTNGSTIGEEKIKQMSRRISVEGDYEVSCKGADGRKILVKGMRIEGVQDLYLVVAFKNGIMDEMLVPVMLVCFVSSLAIGTVLFIIILLQMMINYRNTARIEELAYIDEITGAGNMNYFKTKSRDLILDNTQRSYAIIRFDIANFRYINESYGHESADTILKAIAKKFREMYSDAELCCRINSDQFIALVLNDSDMAEKNHRFEKEVGDEAREHGVKYPIRFKKGIYTVHKDDKSIDIMIDHANAARKSLKGNEKVLEVNYSEGIIRDMKKNDEIVSSMQNALNKGEFKPYLQPKFDIFKNEIVGAEILVRWIKEDGSAVYPSDFIPIFEQNGFIEKLDFYMLEHLCEGMKKYRDTGLYDIVPVSINQSRILLNNPEYLKNVERILHRYDTSIDDVQIEITESVFFNDREKMIAVIDQLKEMGLVLCMDDFGSGYSSLNLLKDVPFDILKIDKDFFSEVDTSRDTMIIMKKIVEMARELGIKVVCEGVETQSQIDMLKKIGCRMVQGYFYSKPIPLADFMEKYLRKDRKNNDEKPESGEISKTVGNDGTDAEGSAE